jgi:hypothetical protein
MEVETRDVHFVVWVKILIRCVDEIDPDERNDEYNWRLSRW